MLYLLFRIRIDTNLCIRLQDFKECARERHPSLAVQGQRRAGSTSVAQQEMFIIVQGTLLRCCGNPVLRVFVSSHFVLSKKRSCQGGIRRQACVFRHFPHVPRVLGLVLISIAVVFSWSKTPPSLAYWVKIRTRRRRRRRL